MGGAMMRQLCRVKGAQGIGWVVCDSSGGGGDIPFLTSTHNHRSEANMPPVWEVGQCMRPHLYLLMGLLARVETGLGSHPALRSPLQSPPKGMLSLCIGRLEV